MPELDERIRRVADAISARTGHLPPTQASTVEFALDVAGCRPGGDNGLNRGTWKMVARTSLHALERLASEWPPVPELARAAGLVVIAASDPSSARETLDDAIRLIARLAATGPAELPEDPFLIRGEVGAAP